MTKNQIIFFTPPKSEYFFSNIGNPSLSRKFSMKEKSFEIQNA
jgi:hypothetical protein